MKQLDNNEPLPTTKGNFIPAAPEGGLSNYKVIDNLGVHGMKNYDTLEEIWKEVNRTTTVEVTQQDLEQTHQTIRAGDIRQKSSRRGEPPLRARM